MSIEEIDETSTTTTTTNQPITLRIPGAAKGSPPPDRSSSPSTEITPVTKLLKHFASLRIWTSWLGKRGRDVVWAVGTSTLILVLPLWLEAEREAAMIQGEQEQMRSLASQGYPPVHIQQMQQTGQFGVPPPPPPLTPQFR
jgi:hypothetical protein